MDDRRGVENLAAASAKGRLMQTAAQHIHDQLAFAREGADNLAKRNGYKWTAWRKGSRGQFTAAFERDGEMWSLGFTWTPKEELGVLATNIERMDYMMRVAMKEFGALKVGAMMRQAAEATKQ